jgi:RimJ/RimL family protein N-acetyltransferase
MTTTLARPHPWRRDGLARGHHVNVATLVDPVVPPGSLRRMTQPVLVVDELVLRPWHLDDVLAIVAAYRDPEIQRWHVRSMTEPEAAKWALSWPEKWRAETGAGWAVVDQDTVVGRTGLRALDLAEGHGEAAYWVIPSARGRNIAARALNAVSAWMFGTVGLHRIELEHSSANLGSCRVARAAGFSDEGTRRQSVRHLDGWHDMHLHARLNDDAPRARGL